MTDLVARPDADASSPDDETSVIQTDAETGDATAYEWAPAEPARKKRRLWLWIGIPVAVAAVGLGAASAVVIAPGTSIGGVPVGGLTPGAAAEAVEQRMADTTIVLTSDAGDAEVTGAELGATVDAQALVDAAFAARPAWNVGEWFAEPLDAPIAIDAAVAGGALRSALPGLYVDPTDSKLAFDVESATYVVTPSVDGEGIDVDAVHAALADAFAAGDARVTIEATTAPVDPERSTYVADATAGILNRMLDSAGFYVGSDRAVPVERKTLASWLTIESGDRGTFDISADANAIAKAVKGLPAAVHRAPVDATVIVNSAGTVLSTPTAGVVGRELDSTAGIAKAYAEQLANGDAVYALPVEETPFKTTNLARMLEVDLSEQRLYVKENGAVVDSWLISSGLPNTPTYTGHYTIGYKTSVQTMRGYDRDAQGNITGEYETPNVRWPMYFNGGQAFHGVYWHSNYGNRMSHGCVGMPEWRAKQIYDWAPYGTDVWIHA
ncbi:L,D-transpeptidase [Microbacterium sp. NPDC019599]|uniref:L,D-transpeptidase family protein n=1 Tax=Microbacterium sp. NPDC019599 TaxID=3154690 RepID=UPI0033D8767A